MKKFKKFLSLVLAAILFSSLPYSNALAAEMVQTVDENVVNLDAEIVDIVGNPDISVYATIFNEASITVTFSSSGMLVEIATSMNKTASIVGVKDIEIQQQVWYGWKTVATSSGGSSSNVNGSLCTVLYPNSVKGETYRVVCTHYGDVDGYRELSNETSGYKCTY